ncbi:MAG: hypothetical protein PHN60_00090 [Candidatus Gracilibacteria bacterium]|nr:hypothetical protein [Candidatus Gracilibacteria bacterium]
MPEKTFQELEKENEKLKHHLEIATRWMRREVEESIHKISKRKVNKMTETGRDDFLRENQGAIISKCIQDYFGDLLLLNAPKETIEYLISSEISFYNLGKNPSLDGFSVIGSYHKILDVWVEQMIVNQFRKFAQKKGATVLRVNDPMEKALHSVVTKKFIFSLGRLYGLLKMIRNGEKLYDFGQTFREYLDKYPDLRNMLLSDRFFLLFEKVIESDVFGGKRHQGSISLSDTKNTRKWIAGDFMDKDGLLYQVLESQAVLY